MEMLRENTESFLQAQAGSRYVARDLAQNIKDREDWLLARRRENEMRRSQGLEPLPEVDTTLPFFKPVLDKSGRDTLDTLLLSAQISSYCGSIRRFADQSFGKLFLASSLLVDK
jgi:translation initiation factor 3 subunit H